MKIIVNNFLFIFISILPLTIIIGPSISLFSILLLITVYLPKFFNKDNVTVYTKKVCILLFILYLYLIFNTLISVDPFSGIFRNLGFLRFLLLFVVINYFFFSKSNGKNVFIFLTIIFSIFIFDVFVEKFSGTNMLGFGAETTNGVNQTRIVSFFKDEAIAGAFINGFVFIIIGYLLMNSKYKNFPLGVTILFFILSLVAVLLTGERSNTIKAFIGFTIFLFFLDFVKFKIKLFFLFFISGLLITIVLSSDYLKLRYIGQLYYFLSLKEKNLKVFSLENNNYIKLYKSGFEVFKNHPFLGVGTKNYRVETCKKNDKGLNYVCNTHPHQIYIELLSEHGILGFILILFILFFLTFRILKQIIISRNHVQIGSFIYILVNFIPLLPSGSFFSDFNLTLFMINFSIMYGVNEKTNIFSSKN